MKESKGLASKLKNTYLFRDTKNVFAEKFVEHFNEVELRKTKEDLFTLVEIPNPIGGDDLFVSFNEIEIYFMYKNLEKHFHYDQFKDFVKYMESFLKGEIVIAGFQRNKKPMYFIDVAREKVLDIELNKAIKAILPSRVYKTRLKDGCNFVIDSWREEDNVNKAIVFEDKIFKYSDI